MLLRNNIILPLILQYIHIESKTFEKTLLIKSLRLRSLRPHGVLVTFFGYSFFHLHSDPKIKFEIKIDIKTPWGLSDDFLLTFFYNVTETPKYI